MIKYYYKVDSNRRGCEICLSDDSPTLDSKIGEYLCRYDCINCLNFGVNWIECRDLENATIKHKRKAKLNKLNSI